MLIEVSILEMILRVLAQSLGAAIGFERELKETSWFLNFHISVLEVV